LQPGKQFTVEGGGAGSRQRLIEMMVRIDQTRNDDMAAGIEYRHARRGRFRTLRHAFDDTAGIDNDTAFRAISQDS
jgi:hypothetical protein